MANKVEKRVFKCPVWVCGHEVQIAGPCTDTAWKLVIAHHTEQRCTKRVTELGRLGAEMAERNGE